jgi:hypothetical protein
MRTGLPKTLVLLLLCSACNDPVETNDFSASRSKQFEQALFAQFPHYQVKNTWAKGGGFIAGYRAFCGGESRGIQADYQVLQSWQLYRVADDTVRSTLEYNLLHFERPAAIDPLIADLKDHNCIDEQTLKMHRLYKIGTSTVLCVSFYKFDIDGFENLLRTEFNRSVRIEVLNAAE